MQLQQFNPNMISITQLRKDIDILEDILAKNDEAMVVRNQDILFWAISPKKYQDIKQNCPDKARTIAEVVADIDALRKKYGQTKRKNAGSNYVIKMRDEAARKWTKK